MHWHNQIISRPHKDRILYGLAEVFWDGKNPPQPGEPVGYAEPDEGWFDSPEEVREHYELCLSDLNKDYPVLPVPEEPDIKCPRCSQTLAIYSATASAENSP